MLPWFERGPLQGSIGLFGIAAATAVLASMANPLPPAFAKTYPERPIQMLIPAGPGSSTAAMMRSPATFAASVDAQPYLERTKAPVLATHPGGGTIAPSLHDGIVCHEQG
jgi:tripartite-type tricarboxylate transporter receptor subunit TctC